MIDDLKELVRLTLSDSAATVRFLKTYSLDRDQLFQLAIAVNAIGVIIAAGLDFIAPMPDNLPYARLFEMPLFALVAYTAFLLIGVLLCHIVARVMGGDGAFEDTFLAFIWLQAFVFGFRAILLAVGLVSTSFAALLNLGFSFWFLWLSAGIIAALYGFRSRWKTMAGVFLTSLLCLFLVAAVMAAFVELPGQV